MQFLSDEVISVPAGEPVTLTRATLDNTAGDASGAKARMAVIVNHPAAGGSTVAIRVGTAPNTSTYHNLPLALGEVVSYEGYDTLVNLQFKLSGATTAKLFVQYFA